MAVMWINGRSLSAFGITMVADPKGWVAPTTQTDSLVPIVGRAGSLRVSRETEIPPRRFTVEAVLHANTLAERVPLWDAFTRWIAGDDLEFRFDSPWPDRVGFGRYESCAPEDIPGMYHAQRFTMTFVMPDPYRYDLQESVYTATSGSEVTLALGSAPCDVRLQMIGTGTAPRVLYKDAQGLIRGDITAPALSLTTDDWIDFNADGYEMAKRLAVASGATAVTALDVPELTLARRFVADPDDGDDVQGPTLSPIGCDLVATLVRAWR